MDGESDNGDPNERYLKALSQQLKAAANYEVSYADGGPVSDNASDDEADDDLLATPAQNVSDEEQPEAQPEELSLEQLQQMGAQPVSNGASGGGEELSLDQLQQMGAKPQQDTSAVGAAAAHAGRSVLPSAASLPVFGAGMSVGAEIGGALGLPAGPLGVALGAVAGAGAAYLVSKAQDWIMDWAGLSDGVNDYMQAAEQQHPIASAVGDVAPSAAAFRFDKAASLSTRAAGAAMFAAPEAGQELYNEGKLDPEKIGINAAAGAILTSPTKFGQRLLDLTTPRAGRPDIKPTVETQETKADAARSEPPKVSLGTATEQPPPSENTDKTIGNPQSSPVRSDREYPTEQNNDAPNPSPPNKPTAQIDTKQIPTDQQAALDQAFGGPAASNPPAAVPNGEGAGSPPVPSGAPAAPAPVQQAQGPAQSEFWTKAPTAPVYEHPELPGVQINRTKDIPWLAGTSNDEKTVYVSPKVPAMINVAGKPLDPSYPLTVHELAERAAIKKLQEIAASGKRPDLTPERIYDLAHVKSGDAQERAWLEARGYDWGAYQKIMHELTAKTEAQPAVQRSTPADLYTKIYPANEGAAIAREAAPAPPEHAADANAPANPLAAAEAPNVSGRIIPAAKGRKQATVSFEPPDGAKAPAEAAAPQPVREPQPAEQPRRAPIVDRAIKMARDAGQNELADRLERLPAATAIKYATTAAEALKPKNRPQVNTGAGTVSARTEVEARNKQRSVDAAKSAFDKFPPPAGVETQEDILARAKAAVAHAQEENLGQAITGYRPKNASAEQMWLGTAARVANRPTVNNVMEFSKLEQQLRTGNAEDVQAARSNKRTEGDIARRQGPSVDVAEANTARSAGRGAAGEEDTDTTKHTISGLQELPKTPEEELIRKQEAANAFDTPHEEAEEWVRPEPLTPDAIEKMVGAPKERPRQQWEIDAETAANKTAKLRALREATGRTLPERPRIDLGELTPEETPEHLASEPRVETIMQQAQRFFHDEGGALNATKLMNALKGFLGPKPKTYAQRYMARDARSDAEDYSRSLSDDFHALDKQDIDNSVQLHNFVRDLPKEAGDKTLLGDLYHAQEKGLLKGGKYQFGQPSNKDMNVYNKNWKPLQDVNDQKFKLIRNLAPQLVGPEVENHVYRMPDRQPQGTTGVDPITGQSKPLTSIADTARNRDFYALERQDGKRTIISSLEKGEDGFTAWNKYKANDVKAPGFELKPGETYSDGKNHYTVKEALTPEIENNANFSDGKPAKYIKNLGVSLVNANEQLTKMLNHLLMYEKLKTDPRFQKFATQDVERADKLGWQESKLKQFRGWRMDPQMKYAFDDFAKSGLGSDALDRLNDFSQRITKLMFITPVPHIMNVGAHAFVGRGWDWINPAAYPRLYQSTAHAIPSVLGQDGFQSGLRLYGNAGTQYDRVISNELTQYTAKKLGEDIQRNPTKWDPVFEPMEKATGVDPRKAVDWLYNNSSRVMWAVNDMFHSQLVMEKMMKMGHDLKDLHDLDYLKTHQADLKSAVVDTERDFPNYRIPSTILNSGATGRIASQIMQSSTPFVFGRYHVGMWNAFANVAKDLFSGEAKPTVEALGKVMALGLAAFVLKPLLDQGAKLITGNKNAEVQPRGPLAIPTHIYKALNGDEDIASAGRSTLTLSPLVTTGLEALQNKDFRGKPIVQPGTVAKAAKGNITEAGRALVEAGGHAARGLISPLGQAAQAAHDRSPLEAAKTFGLQMLDIKNPTSQSVAAKQKYKVKEFQDTTRRNAHPYNLEERIYNRFVK